MGAAARQQRRGGGGPRRQRRWLPASMGPLLDSSGEAWPSSLASVMAARFNGAAARQQRRAPECAPTRGGGRRLQWGRCSTAAERPSAARSPTTSHSFNGAAARQQRRASGGPWRGGGRAASMGPLLDSSGEGTTTQVGRGQGWLLQWGRCSTAAERPGPHDPRAAVRRASMGPLLDSSGERQGHGVVSRDGLASMGPLLDSSGEVEDPPARVAGPARASMGPLLDSSGETGGRSRVRRARAASMGPLLDSSGEARSPSPRPHRPPGFNGAAARQQRRGLELRVEVHPVVASMGPLLDSSGEVFGARGSRTIPAASMGPLLDSSGETLRGDRGSSGPASLQWGRCSTAAERTA